MLTGEDAAALAGTMASGGVAVFPADTVYGLCCAPDSQAAVQRLYAIKGRPADRPAAVMFFALAPALAALPWLGPRTRDGLRALLPGPVTLLLPDPTDRFPLAGGARRGGEPALGVRVPALPPAAAALVALDRPVLQSSANPTGGADARTVGEIPASITAAADLVLDAGPLPGTPSTVVDLRPFEAHGRWSIVRDGALSAAEVDARLDVTS